MTPFRMKNYSEFSNEKVFLFNPDDLLEFESDALTSESAVANRKYTCIEEYHAAMYDTEMTLLRNFQMAIGCDFPEAITALLFQSSTTSFMFETMDWIFPECEFFTRKDITNRTRNGSKVRIVTYTSRIRNRGLDGAGCSYFYSVSVALAISFLLRTSLGHGHFDQSRLQDKYRKSPVNTQMNLNIEGKV